MKKRTDITIEEIIEEMSKAQPEDVQQVGGPPSPPEEAIKAFEALRKAASGEMKIMTVCVRCLEGVSLIETTPCECGGFVCRACQRVEEEGVCDHGN